MKYTLLFFFSLMAASFTYAQNMYKPGFFTLKGNIKNTKSLLIDYGITSYFDSYGGSIAIKPDGSFEQQIPVQNRQNLFLYVSDVDCVYFTVADRDTLQLNWDETDFKKSFVISGKNAERTKELQLEQKVHIEFNPGTLKNLYDTLQKMTGDNTAFSKMQYKDVSERDKTLSELARYELVNDRYNNQVKMILRTADSLSFSAAQYENLYYLIVDIYFQYCGVLREFELLPKYDLKLTLDNFNVAMNTKKVVDYLDRKIPDYTILNEYWFRNVLSYRDFIFNYVNLYQSFYGGWAPYPNSPEKSFNPTLDKYYSAQSAFQIINIKEWFITEMIFRNFGNDEFADVENVYKLALGSITNTYLKDTLQKHYNAVVRLKPGSPAPGFTLKNDKNQTVSLNDYKGKVVYLDFWGVYCGPCISNIVYNIPAIHEHYKNKDVVFINICVDSKKAEWKAALEKYKLGGVNLIAEDFLNTPACKSYNISGVPHYILIDKQGKMVNNNVFNVVNPQALDLNSGANAIDNLLK